MTTTEYKGDVCSHNRSFALDNFIRRMFQNPDKIVGEYINPKDVVIDLGCGPGFFTIEMAKMTGPAGRVHAVDLQNEMLEKVARKAQRIGLSDRISLHKCAQDAISLANVKADFILAYWMVHETPDSRRFLEEVKGLLKADGRLLIVEPLFHVSKKKFEGMKEQAISVGLRLSDTPKKKGGRSLLLTH